MGSFFIENKQEMIRNERREVYPEPACWQTGAA